MYRKIKKVAAKSKTIPPHKEKLTFKLNVSTKLY